MKEGREIFQRNINTVIKELDDRKIHVDASLLDIDHSMRVELVVDVPRKTILSASSQMTKTPFSLCKKTLDNVPGLEGLVIERGVSKKAAQIVGGTSGCVHLLELVTNAIRVASAAILWRCGGVVDENEYARLSDEEKIERTRHAVRNTCLIYKD